MSGGLMSCVRENSPPLDMDVNVSGPLSLPEPSFNNSDLMGSIHSSSHHNIMSSTPLAAQPTSSQAETVGGAGSTPTATPPNTEQTKRRRFHPLRNLRRIFRRRTITSATTSAADTPTPALTNTTASCNSEKNLRSATLSSVTSVASASSPSSPLTHQQLQDAYLTQSLPKSKSAYSSFLGGGKKHQSHDFHVNSETKTKSKHKHKNQKNQQQSKEYDFERHQQQQEAEDMFGTTTQTSASYHHHHATSTSSTMATTATTATTKSSLLSQRQAMGVAVFPGAINRSFFTERQKLRSIGDSSQDLDSGSGNDSGTGGNHNSLATERATNGGSASGGEMSDSQRSLSEGRLVDSDYSRDGLSQSHDSVFSESATASSLSIVLKAELADVLRKRRNRPDASDEDLGLPRSPASPQRRAASTQNHATATALQSATNKANMGEKHSEVSSLSLLSMNSNDGEEFLANSTTTSASTTTTDIVQERSTTTRYSRLSTVSSVSLSSDILRHRDSSFDDTRDEVDLFSSDWQRLSHNAAKHKMAIRPTKKKGGPSRQHRRTLETSIPEANEDFNKFVNKQILEVKDLDTKAKTRSLPPVVNTVKRMDEPHTATKESITKTTKITNSNTTQSTNTLITNTTTTASTNIFGLRNLTTKASAIFETKDTLQNEEVAKKVDVPKKTEVIDKISQSLETETGFLHRLMHRNSKRSVAKGNGGDQDQDELDTKQNEPKKQPVSSICLTNSSSVGEKSKSDLVTYENTVEEKRREIKKDIYQENKILGQILITNNFTMPVAKDERRSDDKSPSKPKSGPAARQRYLPQNISNEDLVKINEEKIISKEPVLSKPLITESFQSTSLIREITKQQTSSSSSPAKIEHHFEKKPKIVGLSTFQQKVSRSNDSFARASSNTSMVSLHKSDDDLTSSIRLQAYEKKQRKSVEKSRSFRVYGEQKDNVSSSAVHNNMPSLPDLSINLKVPYYKEFILNEKEYTSPSPPELLDEKHTSLGFAINDNKLVKPERESRRSFSNYDKNIILTTTTNCSGALKTTPTKLLPPAAVVAPFSTPASGTCNKNISEIENNIDLIVKSPFVSVIRKSINLTEEQAEETINVSTPPAFLTEKIRPTVLSLRKEKSLSDENILNTPSTASVTLRDKPVVKTNALFSGSMETQTKALERKSAPAVNHKSSNGFRCNSTRRSSSVVESPEKPARSTVPEFMKIQLNRVDPARTSKGHVVLAKNVKEISAPLTRECSPEKNYSSSSMDDLSIRRLSSDSVDINERTSPETEKRFSGLFPEAINKQAKVSTGLPPKSPVKKTPTTPTTPPTPTINERDSSGRDNFKLPETLENNNNNNSSNSLSLQERRRLFMNEEKYKMEKKLEEIRFERKKSLGEEVTKKAASKSESEQKDVNNKDWSPVDNSVILRKKSFASSVHSLNGNFVNSSISNNNNNSSNKDDSTPELMKVFARRSLKIKDEDLDKMLGSNANSNLSAPQTLKKFTNPCSNPSVDSDKENQSASDEKLDKLPKLEANQSMSIIKSNNSQTNNSPTALNGSMGTNNNRNSLADFRVGGCKSSQSALSINNNNSSNNNGSSNGESSTLSGSKSFLPPIKVASGLRAMSIERNNNHNNAVSPTKTSSTLERSTIKLGDLSSSSSTDGPINISKTIERSATMAEFKGIHQRRAEWEQRAKEALK